MKFGLSSSSCPNSLEYSTDIAFVVHLLLPTLHFYPTFQSQCSVPYQMLFFHILCIIIVLDHQYTSFFHSICDHTVRSNYIFSLGSVHGTQAYLHRKTEVRIEITQGFMTPYNKKAQDKVSHLPSTAQVVLYKQRT